MQIETREKKLPNSSALPLGCVEGESFTETNKVSEGPWEKVFWGIDRGHRKSGSFITCYPDACTKYFFHIFLVIHI